MKKIKKLTSLLLIVIMMFSVVTIAPITASAVGNNTQQTAKSISINKFYTDNMSDVYDIDYYKFTISNTSKININFKHDMVDSYYNNTYWKINIYDQGGNELINVEAKAHNTNTTSCNVGVPVGTYYIKIEDYSSGGCHSSIDYSFKINCTSERYWETEINNQYSTADSINLNTYYYGSMLDGSDLDYYKFTISNTSKININFKHDMVDSYYNNTYWKINIYDQGGNELINVEAKAHNTNTTSCNVGVPVGTYYIKIEDYSSGGCHSSIDYSFKINCTSERYWETEINDQYSTADNINLNTYYYGSMSDVYDIDYYKFTISNTSKININFKHDVVDSYYNNTYWKIVLCNLNGDSLIDMESKANDINVISYSVTIPMGTYYIKIEDYSNGGCHSSIDYSFSVNKVIPTPYLNTVANNNSGVKVSWYTVSGVDGYYIYRNTPSSTKWKRIATVKGGTKSSYTDKTVSSGTTYTYTVRAYSGSAVSGYQSYGVTIKHLQAPKLKKVSNTVKGAKVYWDKISGASGYYVYRKSGSSDWKKIATVDKGTDSYVDTKVKSGTKYTYTVRAYNGSYKSGYNTNGVSVKYITAPKLNSAKSSKSGITVKWDKISGNSGYYIYRKTGSSDWKKIATVGKNATSYTDKSAKKGTTYTYTIRAYSGSTRSSYYNSGKKCKDLY